MNGLAANILKVLAYFDMFEYPLMIREILRFLYEDPERGKMVGVMQQLVTEGYIFCLTAFPSKEDDLYALRDDPSLVKRRTEGNKRASALLAVAERTSNFLFCFPFVKAVGISGSLSKDFSAEKGDIDYFIITAAGKLWIARTLMHLFKKITFLTGKQHRYCMNYYVDEEALQIHEKNIFTAMEIITLVPACGHDVFMQFLEANRWTENFFPHYGRQTMLSEKHQGKSKIKIILEFILDHLSTRWLDDYLLKITTRRWRHKEQMQKLNAKGNRMGIETGKHFCKPNPQFLQKRILKMYNLKLKEMEMKWDICFEQPALQQR